MTAVAVCTTLIQAVPAAADIPIEDDPWSDRNWTGQNLRLNRCVAGVALHIGATNLKTKAVEGLTGTDEELEAVLGPGGYSYWGPLGDALRADKEAALDYRDASYARTEKLAELQGPYQKT
ncbi:hypothetical protein ACFUIT_14765 [Streptomyces sp. NPDC057239]|uniref:hypothetical protein n=1 Tax=Streptomyces sp. NPDC057239 TaxID=3346061 RepID=UPI003625082B